MQSIKEHSLKKLEAKSTKDQLYLGNDNPGIGKGLKNVSEARGRNEGRVSKDNQDKVIGILQKMGY